VLGGLIGVVATGFLVRSLARDWAKVSDALASANVGLVVLGVVLAGASMAHLGWLWADGIAVFGRRVPRGKVLVWWFVGELGKYVPGGVLSVVGRAEAARRAGVRRSAAYGSVPLTLALRYLAGMVAFAVLVPFDLANQKSMAALVAVLALPVGLVALHPTVLGYLKARAERLAKRPLDLPIPSWGHTVRLTADYLPNWALVIASTWCVSRAISPDAPVLRIALATLLSWILGFLAFPIPAGAGVREAVFVAASGLPAGLGATIAIASRLAFILVDGLGAAVCMPRLRKSRLDDSVRSAPAVTSPGVPPPPSTGEVR
jgi:uncharacterized membrane protein YbhN (UPF0104 family)